MRSRGRGRKTLEAADVLSLAVYPPPKQKRKEVIRMDERVEVGRYGEPTPGWKGWVCTPEWILFESETGEVHLYRREESGAVTGAPAILP